MIGPHNKRPGSWNYCFWCEEYYKGLFAWFRDSFRHWYRRDSEI